MKLNIEVKTEDQRNELIKQLQEMEFKKQLPSRWEELEAVRGFYIDDESSIHYIECASSVKCNNNILATEKQTKSALSKAKLSQLMKVYNDGWEADWNDDKQRKYCIVRKRGFLWRMDLKDFYEFL